MRSAVVLGRLGGRGLGLSRRWASAEAASEAAPETPELPPAPPRKEYPEGRSPRELWRLDSHDRFLEVPEVWVETVDSVEGRRTDLVQLHPDVWRVTPRIDMLEANLGWQNRYRNVIFLKALNRSELPGSGKKIWPQNARLGKSRQKSVRSPLWVEGGIAHGVRGPKTSFFMLPQKARVMGLTTALTLKHVQDDVVVVEDLAEVQPSAQRLRRGMRKEDTRLWEMAEARNWGYSCLFVHTEDVTPRRLGTQCAHVPGFTAMPLFGLNVHSLLKHDTLVIARDALELLEQRLLAQLHKLGPKSQPFRYKDHKERLLMEFECEQEAFYEGYAKRQLLEQDPDFPLLSQEEQDDRVQAKAQTLLDQRPPPFV